MTGLRAMRGQALIEFAIVVTMFLLLVFAIFDFGRVIWANNSLANAAREAARYAIVHGGSKTNTCPVGPFDATVVTPPTASASCPYPSPSKQSIIDAAKAFSVAGGAPILVDVCYGQGCSGSTDVLNATNTRGTPLTVTVKSTVDLLTGRLLGQGTYGVSAKTTMIVNH
jgi:Flp pilus assembly protein TadG